MARIGKKEAARILRRVVEKHGPDTVYADRDPEHSRAQGCRYVNDKGTPLCIVGVALVEEMGVNPNLLAARNKSSVGTLFRNMPEIQALLTESAADVFQDAQDEQDAGIPWGVAVKAATAGIR